MKIVFYRAYNTYYGRYKFFYDCPYCDTEGQVPGAFDSSVLPSNLSVIYCHSSHHSNIGKDRSFRLVEDSPITRAAIRYMNEENTSA